MGQRNLDKLTILPRTNATTGGSFAKDFVQMATVD